MTTEMCELKRWADAFKHAKITEHHGGLARACGERKMELYPAMYLEYEEPLTEPKHSIIRLAPLLVQETSACWWIRTGCALKMVSNVERYR